MEDDLRHLDAGFEDVFRCPHERGIFRLFDLPPELWSKICYFAVVKPEAIDLSQARKNAQQQLMVQQPNITRTCRALRLEALPLFYRHNVFQAHHWGRVACIRKWLQAIGPKNLRSMDTFIFYTRYDPNFWVEKFKETGLTVDVTVGDVAPTKQNAWSQFKTLLVHFA